MSELITRTARLIPYSKRPKQVPSYVTAYLYEPAADEPTAELGNLYIVIEVLVTGRASEEVADLVIEAFGDHYYNQAIEKTPLERFESAIKSTNHQLAEFINQGNAAWIGKLSAVVAVIAGSEIHLCQTGSGDAYLYRHKTHTRIISPAAKPAQPSKTFSSIASGQLEASDKLLFTTPALVHQIALPRLHAIISAHSPNAAIAELTAHLPAIGSERIGVLVIEVTTPELAALQVRSDEPSEIKLGQPENTFEAVKMAAAPVAQSALSSSRKAHSAASAKAIELKPHLRDFSLFVIGFVRERLVNKRGGLGLLVGFVLILILTVVLILSSASSQELAALKRQYGHDYQLYVRAQTQTAAKEMGAANASYDTLLQDLNSLKANKSHKRLDTALTHEPLPANEPRSVDSFIAAVKLNMDTLHGIKRVNAATVAKLSSSPTHIEIANGSAYLVSNIAINIVNLTTKNVSHSSVTPNKYGNVVATTLSSANDGIYLLTDSPNVLFYRFSTDSLSTISLGGTPWEPGNALASYNGNLYIMSQGIIYRHIRTISGFSPKSTMLSQDNLPQLSVAKGLAIDGTVYVTTPNTLQGFLAGVPQPPLTLPTDLTINPVLKALTNYITITDLKSARIGLVSSQTALALVSEYVINGVSAVSDSAYDPSTQTFYTISGSKLLSFSTR